MCLKHRPCKNFMLKLQTVLVQSKEADPFDCNISEEDMALEDVSYLIIDDNDYIIDVQA